MHLHLHFAHTFLVSFIIFANAIRFLLYLSNLYETLYVIFCVKLYFLLSILEILHYTYYTSISYIFKTSFNFLFLKDI